MPAWCIWLCAVGLWNLIVLCVYAIDKIKAKRQKWRIKERTLLTLTFLMGGIGAILGVFRLRHKSQHNLFKFLVPLATVLTVAFTAAGVWLRAR